MFGRDRMTPGTYVEDQHDEDGTRRAASARRPGRTQVIAETVKGAGVAA
jgi:hypothetical protein